MKISLLTYHFSSNNGVIMQTYATCRFLKEYGHNVEIVDLYHRTLQNKSKLFRVVESFIRYWRMRKFKKYYYPPFTKRYNSLKELKDAPPKADCYLIGSDQVWNPNISDESLLAYFLDFGKESIKRISYASSFGLKTWPITNININRHIAVLLCSFSAVSVREEDGKKICQDNFGIDPVVVLDPTMLHDNYEEITGRIILRNEIVCYKLNKNKDFFDNISIVSKELNLPMRLLNNRYPIKGFRYNFPPSTKEWIQRIAGAAFVVTDSFHGIAFSLIYQKQFVVILNDDGKNSRLENLMNKVGLKNRLFPNVKSLTRNLSWKEQIDYTLVRPKIDAFKKESTDYFIKALS